VSLCAVQFHAGVVVPVADVLVGAVGATDDEDLPVSGWQAVGALDVPQVAALQARMHSLADLGERLG
jgi:hypothetical protein